MRLVQLSQLRADTRSLSNQLSEAAVSNERLDRIINMRLARFYDLLVEARGHEYYEQTATLSTTPGSAILALPADHYEILTVIARWGAQELEELASLDHLGDQVDLRNCNQWSQFSPKAWRERGQLIELFPTPSAVTQIEIRYVPACPVLSDPAQTFDGVNGWEVLITSGSAMDLLGLQALPSQHAQGIYQEALERIKNLASERAAANAPTIRDVRFSGDRSRWWRRLPWPVS